MIYTTKSHSLEVLSGALTEKLKETASDDPFVSQVIIVPNLDTARWFKLFYTEQTGIAANMECLLPEEWLWLQVRKIYPDLPESLPSDLQPMKWSLYQFLMDPDIRKKFPVLDWYVQNRPDEEKEEAAFQLSGLIASVFNEYQIYRPHMILNWQKGHSGKGDEKWQAELWRMLDHSWKSSNSEAVKKNRAELYDEVMSALSNRKIRTDDYLYVLNPGLQPLPFMRMMKAVGRETDIFVYQTELSNRGRKNKNELVQLFGQEAEDVRYLINNLRAEYASNLRHEVISGSPLGSIQAGVFKGSSISALYTVDGKLPGIEIRSCHSALREVEVLHQFLLEKFEENENLHPDDVLIATPDPDTYRPYIKAVFNSAESNLPQIPYHSGYSERNTGEGIERALRCLLSLIKSRFDFTDIINFFMMKPVYRSFGLSESDSIKPKQWMEENHVVWGMDEKHREELGQPAEELQTWKAALRRGWAGHLLGGEDGDMVDEVLLFQAVRSTSEQEVWAAFSCYLHRLDVMRSEHKKKRSCSEWTEWLISRMQLLFDEAFLVNPEARNIFNVLDQISNQSTIAASNIKIPYSLFEKELISILDKEKPSGARFTKGVTFSSMASVRSIPFKVVALIGLNENVFPRKQLFPDFDLMAKNPVPGERNRRNEDRNLFLESILAAGQVHYCSYTGQSQVDNETIPPSTVISEWVDVLSKASGLDAEKIIQKETLSGFSPANFEFGKSYSEVYFKTAQNVASDEHATPGLILPRPIPVEETEETIQLEDLVQFYSNPIRWFLRKRFEVALREADQQKDEFILNSLQKHILFQRMFGWMLNEMSDQHIHMCLTQSGAVPVGWCGEREILEFRKSICAAFAAFEKENMIPREIQKNVSLRLGESVIEGSLTSYSADQFVDVNPSAFSGKTVIRSWISHLCCQMSQLFKEEESVLYNNLKRGVPEKRLFLPVQNADDLLSELIDLYRLGLTEPQTFFPKSLFKYEETERDGKKSDPFKKAALEFEGSYRKYGEKNDLSVLTFFGDNVTFTTDFIKNRYLEMISQIMDHMEAE